MKNLNITFEDKEFKKLQNAKEEAKITRGITSWEEFILVLAKVRK